MSYAAYKVEILGALAHASATAHEAHVRTDRIPGYRPSPRKECERQLCTLIRNAIKEARTL